MEVDIGGWLSIFYQFGSTCSGASFCPANHPLAPTFTPRWVHPIRFAYYDMIYLHHCTRVDESRTTSRSFSPSNDRSLFFLASVKGRTRQFKKKILLMKITLRVAAKKKYSYYTQTIIKNLISSYWNINVNFQNQRN